MTEPAASGRRKPADLPSELAPHVLIDHAEFLADRADETDLGRVHARRAVSAAYYAVFHCLTTHAVWTVVPDPASDGDRYELCRAFDHGLVEKVLRWTRQDGKPVASSAGLVGSVASPALMRAASRFILLKDWRRDADYNHLWAIGGSTAATACHAAHEALDAVDTAWDEPGWTSFCALMLLHGTGKAR